MVLFDLRFWKFDTFRFLFNALFISQRNCDELCFYSAHRCFILPVMCSDLSCNSPFFFLMFFFFLVKVHHRKFTVWLFMIDCLMLQVMNEQSSLLSVYHAYKSWFTLAYELLSEPREAHLVTNSAKHI